MANSALHAGLPYPVRNAKFSVSIPYLDADGDPTDPTTPDTEVSKDGGAFADCTEEVTTITGSNGFGYITLTGAETDAAMLCVAAKVASGPKNTLISLVPRALPILATGTAAGGATGSMTLAIGSSASDDYFIGCIIRTTGGTGGGGTGGANNQARVITDYVGSTRVATVVPNWETAPDETTTYDLLLTDMAVNVLRGNITNVSGTAQTARDLGGQLDISISTGVTNTVDGVLDEDLSTHNVANSLGKRIRQIAIDVVHDGIAASGSTSNTLVLDAGASSTDGAYDPAEVFIHGGTGAGQCRLVLQYDGATKTCVVDRNWEVIPDNTSEFTVIRSAGREHVNEGLAQGGAGNTITLDALAPSSDNTCSGQVIFIRSGTGMGQAAVITSYNGTTKEATLDRTWSVPADGTSAYVVLPTGQNNESGSVTVGAFSDGAKDFFRPLLTEAFLSTDGWRPENFSMTLTPGVPTGVTLTFSSQPIGDFTGTYPGNIITLGTLDDTGWTTDVGWTDTLYQGNLKCLPSGTNLVDFDGGAAVITVSRKASGLDPQTINFNILPTDANDRFWVKSDGSVTRTTDANTGSQNISSGGGGGGSGDVTSIGGVSVDATTGGNFVTFFNNGGDATTLTIDDLAVVIPEALNPVTFVVETSAPAPVVGMAMQLSFSGVVLKAGTTDINGEWATGGLPAGDYTLYGFKVGYNLVSETITVPLGGGDIDVLAVASFVPVTPTAADVCVLFGYIQDLTGVVQENVTVTVTQNASAGTVAGGAVTGMLARSVSTDASGYFQIAVVKTVPVQVDCPTAKYRKTFTPSTASKDWSTL